MPPQVSHKLEGGWKIGYIVAPKFEIRAPRNRIYRRLTQIFGIMEVHGTHESPLVTLGASV